LLADVIDIVVKDQTGGFFPANLRCELFMLDGDLFHSGVDKIMPGGSQGKASQPLLGSFIFQVDLTKQASHFTAWLIE
jgi:hypothetical protein